jgi:hypothetical protein
MSKVELPSDAVLIGNVCWGFKKSGYISGLEKLGEKNRDTQVSVFCREVAIACHNSESVQSDPRTLAQRYLIEGILSQEEIEYIYAQFGFNPKSFVMPPHDLELLARLHRAFR